MIRVIAIGKKHESWITDGLERYQKRLRVPFAIEWVLLPYGTLEEESRAILGRIKPDEFVMLLDERGKNISSEELSATLATVFTNKNVTMVIGGAYGVSPAVAQRADMTWSLSRLVFPHMLVRLLLAEQVYRAQEIFHNRPYHHQ